MTHNSRRPSHLLIALLLFALIGILYGNTLTFDYVLEDELVLTKNTTVQQGLTGIPTHFIQEASAGVEADASSVRKGKRFRPLSLTLYSIEYALFGLNPAVSHLINLLLFGLLALLIFLVLDRLFGSDQSDWWYAVPFLTALLFVIHPIHTEVVCHIKGREQLLMLTLVMASCWHWLAYHEDSSPRSLVLAMICFVAALFAKESALPYLVLLPISVWILKKVPLKSLFLSTLPLSMGTLMWLLVRQYALADAAPILGSVWWMEPYAGAIGEEKFATILLSLGKYLELLVFPYHLTHDYSPNQIEIATWSNLGVYMSLVVYVAMLLGCGMGMKRHPILSVGILLLLLPLAMVSNLLFWVGSFVNERLVFEASLGFCMMIGYGVHLLAKTTLHQETLWPKFALIVICLLLATKTTDRSQAWKDSYTLLMTDLTTSTRSAKLLSTVGGMQWEQAKEACIDPTIRENRLIEAQHNLRESLRIYPNNVDALLLMGNVHWDQSQSYDSTFLYYKKALQIAPGYPTVYQNLSHILTQHPKLSFRLATYQSFAKADPQSFEPHFELGLLYGKVKKDLGRAREHFEIAYQSQPDHKELLKALGTIYGRQHQFQTSVNFLERALQIDPQDPEIYQSLSVGYHFLGKEKKSVRYKQKAGELAKQM